MSARRGHGEDSIYFDEAKQRYIGAVSLGWSADGKQRIRRKVSGRTDCIGHRCGFSEQRVTQPEMAGHQTVVMLPTIKTMTREGWGSIGKRDQQPPKHAAARLVCPRTERR